MRLSPYLVVALNPPPPGGCASWWESFFQKLRHCTLPCIWHSPMRMHEDSAPLAPWLMATGWGGGCALRASYYALVRSCIVSMCATCGTHTIHIPLDEEVSSEMRRQRDREKASRKQTSVSIISIWSVVRDLRADPPHLTVVMERVNYRINTNYWAASNIGPGPTTPTTNPS